MTCEYPSPSLCAAPPAARNNLALLSSASLFSENTRRGDRPGGLRPCDGYFNLIRTLALVHVHVLGIDHVARLLVLRAARAGRTTAARSGARGRTGLSRSRCLRRLIEILGDLVQRALDVLLCRTQPRHAALVDGFLRVLDRLFGLLHFRFGDLLSVFADHLLGLVECSVQAVPRLDLFHPAAVVFRVRFGFCPHLLGFFLREAARRGDGDFLFLVRSLVLRAHVQDTVRVDVKRDFDLRRPARRGRNPVQFESAQRTVVGRELALALQNVNLHARLIVRSRRIGFHLARRNRRVPRDLHGHYPAQRLHAEREWRHVQQQDVLYFAAEYRALNRRAYRHDFVRVHALVRLFPAEEVAHQLLHLRNTRRAANEHDFLNVIGRQLGVFQRQFYRLHRTFQQVIDHLLEPRAGQFFFHVNRATRACSDEGQVDFRLHHLRQLDLGLFRRVLQPLQRHLVLAQIGRAHV